MQRLCEKCNAVILENDKFCSVCGEKVTNNTDFGTVLLSPNDDYRSNVYDTTYTNETTSFEAENGKTSVINSVDVDVVSEKVENQNADMFSTAPKNDLKHNSVNNPVYNPADNTVYNPSNNPVDNTAYNPVNNPVNNPVSNPVNNPVSNPVSNPVNNPAYNPIQTSPKIEQHFDAKRFYETFASKPTKTLVIVLTVILFCALAGETLMLIAGNVLAIVDFLILITFGIIMTAKKTWICTMMIAIYGAIGLIISLITMQLPLDIVLLVMGIIVTIRLKKISDAQKTYEQSGILPQKKI